MGSIRIIDILHRAEQFHRDLARYYQRLGDHSQSADVKRALEFMSQHEQSMQKIVQEYEKETPENVGETWVKSIPHITELQCVDRAELPDDVSVDDVIEIAMQWRKLLLDLYSSLADRSIISVDAREAMQRMLQLEDEENRRVVRGLSEGE
jgi:tagatose-1,6-bisphosphate aldolase